MKLKSKIFLLLIFSFFKNGIFIFAQDSATAELNERLSSLIEDYNPQDQDLVERLTELHDNPIELNSDVEKLYSIPFLSSDKISSIIELIKKQGKIKSYSELVDLGVLNSSEAELLKYFTIIRSNNSPKLVNLKSRNCFSQSNKNFANNSFLGNKYYSYQRIHTDYENKTGFNFIAEKDPGEKSIVDYSTYSLYFRNVANFASLILGDYQLEFGQGLGIWSPYAFGKSSGNATGILRRARIVRPNTLSAEEQFFRGIAIETHFSKFSFVLFYSRRNLSANYDSIENVITTIDYSGYHRTYNEMQKANSLQRTSYGLNANYYFGLSNRIGVFFLSSNFNRKVQLSFQQRTFTQYSFLSADYNLKYKRLTFTGEWCWDFNSLAMLNSLKIKLNKHLKFITLFRIYPTNFNSLYGQGFSENSSGKNENGFYTGIAYYHRLFTINFYYDIFKFPYSFAQSLFPSAGNEFSFEIKARLPRKIKLTFLILLENKRLVDKEKAFDRQRHKYRIQFEYGSANKIRAKTRFEFSYFNEGKPETGKLVFQDFYRRLTKNILLNFRVIYFNTPSYFSRIYEFENDIYGKMSNPALYGEGIRFYVLLKVHLFNHFIFEGKYSLTNYKIQTEMTRRKIEKFSLQLRTIF